MYEGTTLLGTRVVMIFKMMPALGGPDNIVILAHVIETDQCVLEHL